MLKIGGYQKPAYLPVVLLSKKDIKTALTSERNLENNLLSSYLRKSIFTKARRYTSKMGRRVKTFDGKRMPKFVPVKINTI